jgi:hypothetical protein
VHPEDTRDTADGMAEDADSSRKGVNPTRFPSPRTDVPDCPPGADVAVDVERAHPSNLDER